jgi:hypothetical protein
MEKERRARKWMFLGPFVYLEWGLVMGAIVCFIDPYPLYAAGILVSGLAVVLFVFYLSLGAGLVERIRTPRGAVARAARVVSYFMYPVLVFTVVGSAWPLTWDLRFLQDYPPTTALQVASVGATVIALAGLVAFNRWHASLKALEHEGGSYVARSPTGGPSSVGTRRSSTSDRIDSQRGAGR